jgi:hypothetical protein
VGDQLADERSESCEVLFPISVCSNDRTKRSRCLTVVRESGAHLFMVTPTTGDGQGQRSRLGIDFMGVTATGRSARPRPGSVAWKGRTTLVLSIRSQHHGECGVSPLVEWITGERRRLVPITTRWPMPGPPIMPGVIFPVLEIQADHPFGLVIRWGSSARLSPEPARQ